MNNGVKMPSKRMVEALHWHYQPGACWSFGSTDSEKCRKDTVMLDIDFVLRVRKKDKNSTDLTGGLTFHGEENGMRYFPLVDHWTKGSCTSCQKFQSQNAIS